MPDAPAAKAGEVPFTLDGQPATARPGEVIISAAERAGIYIPRFCYHPRMKPVGMCRMCLVEVSGPRGATLQPACFVTVAEGMEVVTTSDKVKKAQDGVLEFLLVNHPLDCPVCDKGGECPLQDQTLAYGPGESRFVEEKRHFEKPVPISDLVLLDRERCIQCARCTRFAEEVAGEAQIDFAGRGDRVEVATFPDRPFSSYFSGNTVQICPVGALTATPYRFAARPWDLDQVESTCTTCAFGCRVAVQSSSNRLTRLLGLDSDPVNQSWMCDKGRFVYEAVNGGEVAESRDVKSGRVTEPMVRREGELVASSWAEALSAAAAGIDRARQAGGPGAVALIGGARSTNEGAYAWTKLAKGVIGTDSVDAQLGDGLPAELVLSLPRATIDETCNARVVVLLCGDVREELPVLFLRLRGAALSGRTALVELSPLETSLSPYAAVSLRLRPGDAPDVADALVDAPGGPAVPEHPEGPSIDSSDLARARALLSGAGPGASDPAGSDVVVVLGRQSLAEHETVVAGAALSLARALPGARFLTALRRGNVMGALDVGMAPGLLPGRTTLDAGREWFTEGWGSVPEHRGLDAAGTLRALAEGTGEVRALVLVGAEPVVDHPDRHLARQALEAADFVVAVTGHVTSALAYADVVLPAAVEHERPGTTSNVEGRVARLGQKLVPPGAAWPDWAIAAELAVELGGDLGFTDHREVWREIERLAPCFAGMTQEVLDAPSARDGLVAPCSSRPSQPRTVLPVDPMATPGVESVERQGAPPRVGLAEPRTEPGATVELPAAPEHAVDRGSRPAPGAGLAEAAGAIERPHVPPADSYSLRLVAARTLYDQGAAVRCSPSLVPLVDDAVARANPYDLDRLGASSGDPVTVRSSRGSLTLVCHADETVPRGVVSVAFNLSPGVRADAGGPDSAPDRGAGAHDRGPSHDAGKDGVAALIDAAAAVTDVRLESVR